MSLFSSKLRKASYNGVSFEVTASTIKFGRRTVTHEYPQRDEPYTEDLGRSARTFDITGFIVGETYIAQTKRLLKALEASSKNNEPGKLVHPWMGTLSVCLNSQPKVDWNLEQGITNITLSFVEAGNLNNPSIAESWGNKLRSAVDGFIDDSLSAFGLTMEQIEEYSKVIDEIANGSYMDILGSLQDSNLSKLFDLGDSLENLANTATQALSLGAKDLGKDIASALGLGAYINSVRNWRDSAKALIDAVKNPVFAHHATTTSSTSIEQANNAVTTYARQLMLANLAGAVSMIGTSLDEDDEDDKISTRADDEVRDANNAVTTYARQLMLANLAGAVSMIGTSLDEDDEDDKISTRADDEVRDLRDETLNILIREQQNLGTDEHALFNALDDLIISVYHYLSETVLQDNQLFEFTPKTSAPVLTLAYDKYSDALRADEIVRRNGIVNPLFTPVKALKISQN